MSGDISGWVVAFLGVIALGSLVQIVFLLGLLWGGRQLFARVRTLQERYDREVRPVVETVALVSRNMAEISDLAVLQARRVDDFMLDTTRKVEQVTGAVRAAMLRPLAPLSDLSAFLRGLRRGIEAYQQLGGLEAQARGPGRGYSEEDEHLFI